MRKSREKMTSPFREVASLSHLWNPWGYGPLISKVLCRTLRVTKKDQPKSTWLGVLTNKWSSLMKCYRSVELLKPLRANLGTGNFLKTWKKLIKIIMSKLVDVVEQLILVKKNSSCSTSKLFEITVLELEIGNWCIDIYFISFYFTMEPKFFPWLFVNLILALSKNSKRFEIAFER